MRFIIDYFYTDGYESDGTFSVSDNIQLETYPKAGMFIIRIGSKESRVTPDLDFFWSSFFNYAIRSDYKKMLIANDSGFHIYSIDLIEGTWKMVSRMIRDTDEAVDLERFLFRDEGDTILALYEHGVVVIDSETLIKRWSVDNLTFFNIYLKIENGVVWYTNTDDDEIWGYKLENGEMVKP